MPDFLDRKQLKSDARELLQNVQIPARLAAAIYLILSVGIGVASSFVEGDGVMPIFFSVLSELVSWVLTAGFILYCMTVRRHERAEYSVLFEGFSFAGKLVWLNLIMYALIFLWSMLFVIPGIIAAYRYRFAVPNLCANPELTAAQALDLSKKQTEGWKMQLVLLDLSFLPWILLAAAPSILSAVNILVPEAGLAVCGTVWFNLAAAVWSVLVAILYIPVYQCVELDYFDAARRPFGTSDS